MAVENEEHLHYNCVSNNMDMFHVHKSCKKKKDDDLSTRFLPLELVIEILLWLPFKSLVLLQLVCKKWRQVVHEHHFMERHTQNIPVIWHHYNVRVNWGLYSLTTPPPRDESCIYMDACDGLVLLKSRCSCKIWLWNPATRRVLDLPNLHNECHNVSIAYVEAIKDYKIVSIFGNFKESNGLGCEVFIPGKSKAWRRIAFPDVLKEVGPGKIVKVPMLSTGVYVHCIYIIRVDTESFAAVVSLHIETERFLVTHLPKGVVNDWQGGWVLDCERKLTLAKFNGEDLEVMELEDWKMQTWSGERKTVPLPFVKECQYDTERLNPLFCKQGQIWFWLKNEKVFTYSVITGERFDIEIRAEAFAPRYKIYPYKPSMVTFEGMEPDTKFEWMRHGVSI